MDEILKRRSVRKYKTKEISGEILKKILTAAMNAPSAGNEQPWHFIIVKNKETLKKISSCSPYARAAASAPVAIIVCGDLELEHHKGFWVQDCSAAVMNMLLEITSLNLGSVWLGVYPLLERVDFIREEFKLPGTIVPFAIVPVGYPDEESRKCDRFNEERVHWERW